MNSLKHFLYFPCAVLILAMSSIVAVAQQPGVAGPTTTTPTQTQTPPPTPTPSPTPAPTPAPETFNFSAPPMLSVKASGIVIRWITNQNSTGTVACGASMSALNQDYRATSKTTDHSVVIPLPTSDSTLYCQITAASLDTGAQTQATIEIDSKQISQVRNQPAPKSTPNNTPTENQPTATTPANTTPTAQVPAEKNPKHLFVKVDIENSLSDVVIERDVRVNLTISTAPIAQLKAMLGGYRYMLSESPTFAGATWQPFAGPIDWKLTTPGEMPTLYAKVKNQGGDQSAVVSKSLYIVPATTLANIKRSFAIVGASILAFFGIFNWANLLSTLNDLKDLKNEAKSVDHTKKS